MIESSGFGFAKRLYAMAAVLSIGLVGVAALAYIKLTGVHDAAAHTESQRVPQLIAMGAMELTVTKLSLQLRHAMLSRTPAELQSTLSDIEAKRTALASTLKTYEAGLFTEEGKRRFKPLPGAVSRFSQVADENLALITSGQKAEAFAFLVDKTIPVRNELLAILADGVDYQKASLSHDIQHIEAEVSTTLWALVSLVVGAVVALVVVPIVIALKLRRRIADSQALAERVRDGDLTQAAQDRGHDEFTPLLHALNSMQKELTRVVGGVRGGAELVASASAQIAQGNADLSLRTEQQASSLQETAASMEELGSTARQNADSARQANQLAANASDVAVQGGQVVGQVVEMMKDINASSKRIADIIGVIDGIAFQTNILALNAAVEAARAGEQGRGFAVVAGEVRNLAQRSAEAAKEIKTLITASVERVDQGSSLVDQAGTTMDEIVVSIKRVADIVGEISSASVEQNSGVQLVSQAVTQMDNSTQQNASLVEQGAAAAASLRCEADKLVAAVAVFRLERVQA